MKALLILFLILGTGVAGGGCGTCKDSAANDAGGTPFIIDLSSGGGFSGMHSGFTIKSDGSVLYWQGMYGRREDVRPLGSMDAGEIRRLKALIDEQKLASVRHRETGNMTTSLSVAEGELLYTISWPGMTEDASDIPEAVRPVHAELQRLLASFQEKAMKEQQNGGRRDPVSPPKDR
ncbi:MAG: hypothetical protein IPP94_12040 [Ignavibacteria bacterium]|nr:hypothetical protein [Ignavibacteria bacterium]